VCWSVSWQQKWLIGFCNSDPSSRRHRNLISLSIFIEKDTLKKKRKFFLSGFKKNWEENLKIFEVFSLLYEEYLTNFFSFQTFCFRFVNEFWQKLQMIWWKWTNENTDNAIDSNNHSFDELMIQINIIIFN
jgi:hypothetical protein